MTSKAPAFQFYTGDWMQDTRCLSLAAKGAWIDLLCAMWRSQTRGKLTLPLQGYARLIGATVDQTKAVIDELTDMQICDNGGECNGNVTLTNRRMVKDERERELTRCRVERHRNADVKRICNDEVTPLSSSSSSTSVHKERKLKTVIPDDFTISDRVKLWAKGKSINHLSDHLDNFVLCSKAKGYQYVDWDAAFMNAIRNNWAKIESGNGNGKAVKPAHIPSQEEDLAEFNKRWDAEHGRA